MLVEGAREDFLADGQTLGKAAIVTGRYWESALDLTPPSWQQRRELRSAQIASRRSRAQILSFISFWYRLGGKKAWRWTSSV